jgi:hypothetical protein
LFSVVAQAIIGIIFLVQEDAERRKKMIRVFSMSAIIIAIVYAFWIPVILAIKQNEQTWIPMPANDFMLSYFKEYFGNDDLLHPILLLLMAGFFVAVALKGQRVEKRNWRNESLLQCFVLCFFWIFISCLIPYVRSLRSVPLLYPRYTIVVVPAYILILAYGISIFKLPLLKYSVLAGIVGISLINLIVVKRYYTDVHKTQFREMTEFVAGRNMEGYPVLNEVTQWQQAYYMRKLKVKGEQWTGKKEALIDSVKQRSSPKYDVAGFWVVGAHGDKKPDSLAMQSISERYAIAVQKDFFDAWAIKFIRK